MATFVLSLSMILPTAVRCDLSDGLEDALLRARATQRLLVVAFVRGGDPEARLALSELMSPAWRDQIAPHESRIVSASENPSLANRFAVREFPFFVVLDGEGREAGRLPGQRPLEETARRLRDVLDSAERYHESRITLDREPGNFEALYWVGMYNWNRGERALALQSFERLAALAPPPPTGSRDFTAGALRMLGEARLDSGRFEEAEDFFRRALERPGPDDHSSRAALGLCRSLRRQGRVREAVQTLEDHFPWEASGSLLDEASFTLGYLYLELGENEKGARHLRAVVERSPRSIYAQRAKRYGVQADGSSPLSSALTVLRPAMEARPLPLTQAASHALTTVSFTGSNLSVDELR